MVHVYNLFLFVFGFVLLSIRYFVVNVSIITISNSKIELSGVVSICGAIISTVAIMNYFSKRQIENSLNKNHD